MCLINLRAFIEGRSYGGGVSRWHRSGTRSKRAQLTVTCGGGRALRLVQLAGLKAGKEGPCGTLSLFEHCLRFKISVSKLLSFCLSYKEIS